MSWAPSSGEQLSWRLRRISGDLTVDSLIFFWMDDNLRTDSLDSNQSVISSEDQLSYQMIDSNSDDNTVVERFGTDCHLLWPLPPQTPVLALFGSRRRGVESRRAVAESVSLQRNGAVDSQRVSAAVDRREAEVGHKSGREVFAMQLSIRSGLSSKRFAISFKAFKSLFDSQENS